jgi:cytochrome c-type biogenesis protein CcmH/NrfG
MRPTSATGGPPTVELPPPAYISSGAGRGNIEHALEAAEAKRRRLPKLPLWALITIPLLLIILIGGWVIMGRGSSESGLNGGVMAMQAGQREKARSEFAKAVKDNPSDATPHVFLARLAREESDLTTARAQLDTALRLQPTNSIALREMGLILFSSRQYDLARRFFVRAVQANPQDRASQGYLGCALMRLNRVQEGTKFISNAGTGSWTACLRPVTTAAPPPL